MSEPLRDALERTLGNFERLLQQKPVRDATETIQEARAALAEPRVMPRDVLREVERVWLRPVNDSRGRPTWVCRNCAVAGAHLDGCLVAETLDRLAAVPSESDAGLDALDDALHAIEGGDIAGARLALQVARARLARP